MHTKSIFIFFYFSICFWQTTSTVWRFANIGVIFCFSGCSDCTFNLCTPTRPVILPGNEKLVLAPYHTFYPSLEEHLQGPWGIPIEPNLWNDPLVLGKKYLEIDVQSRVTIRAQFNLLSDSPKALLGLIWSLSNNFLMLIPVEVYV